MKVATYIAKGQLELVDQPKLTIINPLCEWFKPPFVVQIFIY